MQIDIVSDTICPWCFIGKRRLEKALAARSDIAFEVNWRPFQLNPDMPAGGMDRATYVERKFGGPEGAERIYRAIAEAGESEGIAFAFERIARTPNTVDSHRLIRWAGGAGAQDRVVELLFRRYFLDGADIGDAAVLADVAGEAGMDGDLVAELLKGDEDADKVRAEDVTARQMGITGVPCFLIERKYAVSGAQDPAVLLQAFALAAGETAP